MLALLAGMLGFSAADRDDATYRVIRRLPHDPRAFTQGMLFHQGFLYESTGLYGQSSLRKVDPESGEVLKARRLQPAYFGEGLALFGNTLIQLTWQSRKAFVYDSETFQLIREFQYDTEGWGLTHDGRSLIMSDGSSRLYFRNPNSFALERVLPVTENGRSVAALNELEYIHGEIWANIFQTPDIVRISPESGQVLGRISFKELVAGENHNSRENVLNGIAYDPGQDRIFITGKRFSYVYEVQIRRNSAR